MEDIQWTSFKHDRLELDQVRIYQMSHILVGQISFIALVPGRKGYQRDQN